jgi:Secretion system C-terminal sorting domain
LYACSNASNFQSYINGSAGAVTNPQTISGNGVYRNTSPVLNVTAAGTGYTVGNILTLNGGTSTSPLTIYVTAVNGTGGITSAVTLNTGAYTVVPTGANAATGGSGSGATFTTPTAGMTTAASFSGLTFNNTSAAGVTISSFGTALPSQTATINGGGGVLTLIAGAVNNGSNTIVVGNSVAQKGSIVATAGYVTGKIKRWFSAATNTTTTGDLPVGKNGAPHYARVEFTTAPTKGGTLTAEYIATAPGLAGFPINDGISLANIQNTGFWRIDTDSITGGNYTISLTDTIPTGVQSLTTLRSVKRATGTSTWSVDGTAGTNTGIATKPTVVRTGVSGFSEFAIAGASDNLLPVASLKFTGARIGNTNQLKWTVTNEVAVKGYDLQRSADGNNFNTIANVLSKADGSNNAKLDYVYNDNNSITTDGYYRLKQIAKDGSVTYSNIVVIKGSKVVGVIVGNIYPNPVKDMLNVVVASSSNKSVTAIVTSVNGKQVFKASRNLNNGDTNLQLDLSKIAAGTYTIVMIDANGNKSNVVSFVKE